LDVDLVELAVATLLRPLVTEHRAHAPDLLALVVQQAVGDAGAHDAGGGLGTQRERVAAAVLERVHLLLDDVGHLADGALEELGALEQRQADLAVAVLGERLARDALARLPRRRVVRQDVVHATHGLEGFAHGPVRWVCAQRTVPSASILKRATVPPPGTVGTVAGRPLTTSDTPGALPIVTLSGAPAAIERCVPARPRS